MLRDFELSVKFQSMETREEIMILVRADEAGCPQTPTQTLPSDLRWKGSQKIRMESEHALALRKNEGFEHVGASFLIGSKQLEQVRHRNHSAKALFTVNDQQVKDSVLIHRSETVLDRCLRGRGHELPRHDFGNAHPCRTLILGRHFVGNVALRDDS